MTDITLHDIPTRFVADQSKPDERMALFQLVALLVDAVAADTKATETMRRAKLATAFRDAEDTLALSAEDLVFVRRAVLKGGLSGAATIIAPIYEALGIQGDEAEG